MLWSQREREESFGGCPRVPPPLQLALLLVILGPNSLLAQGNTSSTSPQTAAQTTGRPSESPAASAIGENQLVGLPLNGRSYSQLATLQAGVSGDTSGSGSRGISTGGLNIVGGRSTSNSFLLDGTSIMNTDNQVPRSAAGVQLGSDAVMQVQVFSASYGADHGLASGGVLNSITRSGGNEFHGSLFEFFRNSKLDARAFFDPPEPPPFKRNQFGFLLTGPLKRDRTFFMGSFEAMRDRQTDTDTSYFPDKESRLGIITDSNGITIRTVPVNQAVKPYLDLFPIPNSVRLGGGIGENFAPQFVPTDENFFAVRVDHQLADRHGLFVRYTFDDATSRSPSGVYLFGTVNNSRQQYLTLVTSHIFSLSVVDSFRLSYTRPVDVAETYSLLAIPPSLYFVPGAPQFGNISVPGLTGFGPPQSNPSADFMNTFQFANDLVVSKSAHSMKFGFDIHRYRWDTVGSFQKSGSWSFNSLESFLQGGTGGTNLTVVLPGSDNRKAFRQTVAGFYFQDDYQAAPRLQLNLGVRYEFATVLKDKYGRTHFLPDPVRDSAMQVGPYFKDNPSLLNFSPRLGATWSLGSGGNTVLNAGFGIYYDQYLLYTVQQIRSSAPFYGITVRTNFDSSRTFPDALASASTGAGNYRFTARPTDYNHMRNPMVLRYNFAVQQQIPGGMRLQATYVGARGNHLLRTYDTNLFPNPVTREDGSLFFPPNAGPINPAFADILLLSSDAQSFYNSLQLSASKSLGGGLSLQGNYTLSKSVDDSSNTAGSSGQYGAMRTLNRGVSDFNSRHRLSLNYFYNLPLGGGRRWLRSGPLAAVLGGWRVGGIVSFRTGTFLTPQVSIRSPGYLFSADRPNLLPGRSNNPVSGQSEGCGTVPAGQKLGTRELYFDPCVFGVPLPGTMGNLGRNTIVAPGQFTMDLSLQKEFSLDSSRRLQFRAELFNLSNHTNFNRPLGGGAVVFTPGGRNSFTGRIGSVATIPRQVQFALRLSF